MEKYIQNEIENQKMDPIAYSMEIPNAVTIILPIVTHFY